MRKKRVVSVGRNQKKRGIYKEIKAGVKGVIKLDMWVLCAS